MTGSVILRGRKDLLFCEQKRSKKNFDHLGLCRCQRPWPRFKKFFAFFSKKKSLPLRIELTDRTVIGHTGWYNAYQS